MINDEAVESALAALGAAYGEDAYCKEREYVITTLQAAIPFLAEAARQPQRNSPTVWPDIPRAQS